jgi:hypothetical protein
LARQGRFFARPSCTMDLHDRGNAGALIQNHKK